MRKHRFFSLAVNNGQPVAVCRDGYTDGTYNYYKYGRKWFAIDPKTGRSVSCMHTRSEASAWAHDTQTIAKVEKIKASPKYAEMCAQFRDARLEAFWG